MMSVDECLSFRLIILPVNYSDWGAFTSLCTLCFQFLQLLEGVQVLALSPCLLFLPAPSSSVLSAAGR